MDTSGRESERAPRRPVVQWVIAFLLGAIAVSLWSRPESTLLSAALAQSPGVAGARGVYAFTGQIDANRHGLFMLDVEQGTIWCYEIDSGPGGTRQLRLVTARAWIYDRYLQDFNCGPPDLKMVQGLVAQQRASARPAPEEPAPAHAGDAP